MENPTEVNKVLLDFLADLDRSPST
ncbi:alpha/beta hydrolase [Prescottella equi NBRC 101255 = C 7]|nr:alpha/beta hydrolase [Prescottella equi NBRC 101255 = C 7]